jgi:predicted phosphoadenosine phosphosulfate sulfurtransferase
MGAKDIKLPEGHTWKSYANFLLDTIEDEEIKQGYLRKLKSSMRYWTVKGGALPQESAEELRQDAPAGTEFLGEPTDNRKRRGPYEVVRFRHYPDDIPAVSDLSLIPTYKRLVITILRCDHACKYMGFGQTKREQTRRAAAVEKYREIL